MNILILGGTIFLGKHLVNEALKRGHNVTLFNRGKHNPELFPDVEKIHGDRMTDISMLAGKKFDTVIDTCGYFPRAVRTSAGFLKENVPHYVFISSISVYSDLSKRGVDESGECGIIEDETIEQVTGESYGPLKRLCEKAAEEIYGDAALNIRPGLIVGEDDPSDRFTYWPARVKHGGRTAVPADTGFAVQFIDVKDLSSFTLDLAERGVGGIFNATGPEREFTMKELLAKCEMATGTRPEYVPMPEEILLKNNVAPYTELPLWVPADWQGTNCVSIEKALKAGLRTRAVEETIGDALRYFESRGDALRSGLKKEREDELIKLLDSEIARG